MRTEIRKSAPGWLLAGACVVCWESASAAKPEQNAPGNIPKQKAAESPAPSRPEAVKLAKTTILVKNTKPKAGPAAPATLTKPTAVKEKRTVGRYWRQLMSTLREVNHAHRAKK